MTTVNAAFLQLRGKSVDKQTLDNPFSINEATEFDPWSCRNRWTVFAREIRSKRDAAVLFHLCRLPFKMRLCVRRMT